MRLRDLMKSDICPYLFVYGTLRRGGGRDLRDLIGVSPKFLGSATAAGRLYDLGSYPGMCEPSSPGERVAGELYQLGDVLTALPRVDAYEDQGCHPEDGALFRRCLRDVELDGGARREAWAYLYQGETAQGQHIVSGDYFKRRA